MKKVKNFNANAIEFMRCTGFVLRDRDGTYGKTFRRRVAGMGIKEVIIAPWSPWQNAYAERVIGSVRRECLDHVIVLNERHLRRILNRYLDYYHSSRTHLSLSKDTPGTRPISTQRGNVIPFPKVGGLHHHYERIAAWSPDRLNRRDSHPVTNLEPTLGPSKFKPALASVM